MTAVDVSILLADSPAPEQVRPGWIAFLIVFLMAVALFFLMWSMIKQFRKVDFVEDDEPGDGDDDASGSADVGDTGDAHEHDVERETNGSTT